MGTYKVILRRKTSSGYTGMYPSVKLEGFVDKGSGAVSLFSETQSADNRFLYMTSSGFKLGTAAEVRTDFGIAPSDHGSLLHSTNYLDDIYAEAWQPDIDFYFNQVVTYSGYAYKCIIAPGLGTWTEGGAASTPDSTPGSTIYWLYLGVSTMTVDSMLNAKADLDGNNKILYEQLSLPSAGAMKYLGAANLTGSTSTEPIMLSSLFSSYFGTLSDTDLEKKLGGYLIVSNEGWVDGSDTVGGHDYVWREEIDDDQNAGDVGLHLEAGDWIIFTGFAADGGDSGYNDIYFAVMNNSFRNATTAYRGVVQLSTGITSRVNLATASNYAKTIDEKALRDVMREMQAIVQIDAMTDTKVLMDYAASYGGLPTLVDRTGYLGLAGPTGPAVNGLYPYTLYAGFSDGYEETPAYATLDLPIDHFETDWLVYDSYNQTYFKPSTAGSTGTFSSATAPLDDDLLIVFE